MKSRNCRNGGCNTMNNEMDKGFSLIELLVVIAIMGIFIGASFAFVGLIQAGNMTSVTKSIATGIQETRQKTMTQNLLYGWRFSVNTDADGSVSMTVTKQAAATQTPVDTVTELKKCDLYYTKDSDEEVKITGFAMTFDASTGAIKSFNYALADGGTAMQTSGTGRIRRVNLPYSLQQESMRLSSMKLDRAHKRDGFSDNKGITLIEVLIGIAIMGIVSSMISAIMVGGTNFFRKQSATIDLQNDSQLITSSMSAAILEGTNFTLEEMDGRKVVYFITGTPAAEGENKAVAKQYIWVEESPYGDAGYLYIYDAGAVVDYNKGNCISELVRYFKITVGVTEATTDASGNVVYTYNSSVKETNKIEKISVSFTLANSKSELTQSIEIKPRNTVADFKKLESGT